MSKFKNVHTFIDIYLPVIPKCDLSRETCLLCNKHLPFSLWNNRININSFFFFLDLESKISNNLSPTLYVFRIAWEKNQARVKGVLVTLVGPGQTSGRGFPKEY